MPEQSNEKTIYSLLEVTRSIQKVLAQRYTSSFWVKAEMNKLNFYRQSGHAYPELVEKKDGKIIAQLRANLWRDDYNRINQQFQEILKEPLKDGIKILFLARISFDPVHGLALQIQDIDPSFTLGDLEREKQENLQRLVAEGLYNRNRQLPRPVLPQRIAIISVETSKGFADFNQVIDQNPWGYQFFRMLFPAVLQGDKAAADIIRQLNRIKKVVHHFDVVAIIRGGGGDVGLSCYNNYTLAKTICEFPIPVLTGIGHSTNETVAEMVAHVNAITPTRLAEFLIQQFHNFSVPVQEAEKKIIDRARRLLTDEKTRLLSETRLFRSVTENALLANRQYLRDCVVVLRKDSRNLVKEHRVLLLQYVEQLQQNAEWLLREQNATLDALGKNLELMSPAHVLKRGYSITRLNGKAVRDATMLNPGDELQTVLFNGSLQSIVTSTQKPESNEQIH